MGGVGGDFGSADAGVNECSSAELEVAAQNGFVDDSLNGLFGGCDGDDDCYCHCCWNSHAERFRIV